MNITNGETKENKQEDMEEMIVEGRKWGRGQRKGIQRGRL